MRMPGPCAPAFSFGPEDAQVSRRSARGRATDHLARMGEESQGLGIETVEAPAPEVDELRLIVRALADIREALRTTDGPNPLDSTI